MAEPVVSTTEPLVTSDGSHEGFRNPDLERDADHYGPGTGGKKRKVPAFTQTLGRSDEGPDTKITDHPYPQTFPVRYRAPRSKAATACSFRKALFLRRKAALITLYIDAQNAVIAGTAKMGPNGKSPLMDVPSFEKLMPSLEDVGISDWPPDRPSWRTKWEETAPPRIKTLEQWKTKFAQRQRAEAARKPTVRGGWAPEGSFEFEKECEASTLMRARAKDRASLHKLVVDLRGIALSAKPPVKPITTTSVEKPPQKAQRTVQKRPTQPQSALESTVPLSQTPSKESDAPSGKLKQKKKKKKRSVLANQGNPHHVDNYRPTRKALAQSDPYEPYPHHASLLFPPPMRLLATGPQRRTAPLPGAAPTSRPVRAAEDDFVCCFCEIDLFFGSEHARKRAIRRMKAERRRKENIRNKAKDVAEGKGTLKDDETDFEDDYSCGDDDGTGRCTCGRQISDPHRSVKSRLKPPETDPPDDEHHHVTGHGYVDHEHGHHHDDHDYDDHDHDHHCHDHDHDHDHDHGDEHVYDHEYYHREGQFAENDVHVHDDVD